MKNAWFWFKFFILMSFAAGVGLFSLPENITEKLPENIQKVISNNQMKLGIDLAGGAKLEYLVDFEEAEQKAKMATSSPEEFEATFNKKEIANGVVKTLKKRIDPDGTKEVNVFASERGGNWYVSIELTKDIDTPENRKKLEKVTSLAFKEPLSSVKEKKELAQSLLSSAQEKSFDEIAKPIVIAKEGNGLNLEKVFLDELIPAFKNEELAKKVLNYSPTEKETWYNEVIELDSNTFALVYFENKLSQEERTLSSSEKTFTDAKKEFSSELKENIEIKDLPESLLSLAAELNANEWKLSDENILLEKTKYDEKKGQYFYSYIDISTKDSSVRDRYKLKEITKTEPSRFVRILYYTPQWKDTALGGGQFKVAKVGTDTNTGYPVTNIEFTPEGARLFSEITGRLAAHKNTVCGATGDVFAIFVDGKEISAPCVRERIDGNAQISFNGTSLQKVQKEANELVENLNSGATPAPVKLVSERKISASLGEKALQLSIQASLIGFALVALWMLFFFRYFGFLAIVALGFYALVLLFLFKFFGFVLTLSGVAGVILSIGMAVDANVLIFERIKEELRDGVHFDDAVIIGFDRAWTSIRDSNISSLITCFILYALGTSIIMAFAITLAIGILVSMFTAITFTRYLIIGLTPKSLKKSKILVGKISD